MSQLTQNQVTTILKIDLLYVNLNDCKLSFGLLVGQSKTSTDTALFFRHLIGQKIYGENNWQIINDN